MKLNAKTRGADFTRETAKYLQQFDDFETSHKKIYVMERGKIAERFVPRVPTMDGLCVFMKASSQDLEKAKSEGTPALRKAIELADTQISALIQEMTLNKQLDHSAGIFLMKARHGMKEEKGKGGNNKLEITFVDDRVKKIMK